MWVVAQEGGGGCCCHARCFWRRRHGLARLQAEQLRRQLAAWVEANGETRVAGTKLEDWVRLERGVTIQEYVKAIRVGGWGGSVELVACARWWGMHVWVYVAGEGGVGFERVAEFEAPESVAGGRSMEGRLERTAHVLFRSANHYDALEPDDRELRRALGVTRVGGATEV